jgi:hypothetical protein
MRIALTTALMVMAAMAFADEPSAPEPKTEAAAEAAADKSAAQPTATETTANNTEAKADKPFKPPAGYKAKRSNGEQMYCSKTVILGSKFPIEDCRTEAQLRDMERNKRTMREDLNKARTCSGVGCNAH